MRKNSLAILVVFAEKTVIDNYVVFLAEQLKALVKTLVITVNGKLDEESTSHLSNCSDYIFFRENKGFDCGAYKDTLESNFGWDKIRVYDELILLNDSCYGPIYPLEPVFNDMDKHCLDFWGITEQTPVKAGNYDNTILPYHIQTYFVVIRKRMMQSTDFSDFWHMVKVSNDYDNTVANFELKFTAFFNSRSYTSGAYVDCGAFCKSTNEIPAYIFMNSFVLIAEHKCPFLKKKVFLYPHNLVLSSNAGETAYKVLDYITNNTKYDENLIWQHLIKKCEPKELSLVLHNNYCLPRNEEYELSSFLGKALVIATLSNNMILEKCQSYLKGLPSYVDVIQIEKESGFKGYNINKYDYVCILNNLDMDESLIPVYWENMISSASYVNNIIHTFHVNPKLGLLSPPKPYHGLHFADLQSDYAMFPFGGIFWCRREALQPLWEEKELATMPRPDLPTMARNLGYYCGTAMTDEYASVCISNYHYMLSGIVNNVLLDRGIQEFKNIRRIRPQIVGFCYDHPVCYIYGAGECGQECNSYLKLQGLKSDGYIVSDGRRKFSSETDMEMLEFSEVVLNDRTGIIIALNPSNTNIIVEMLEKIKFYEYIRYEIY